MMTFLDVVLRQSCRVVLNMFPGKPCVVVSPAPSQTSCEGEKRMPGELQTWLLLARICFPKYLALPCKCLIEVHVVDPDEPHFFSKGWKFI